MLKQQNDYRAVVCAVSVLQGRPEADGAVAVHGAAPVRSQALLSTLITVRTLSPNNINLALLYNTFSFPRLMCKDNYE